MDANPGATGERAGTRSSSRAVLRQPACPWQVFLLAGLAWLLIAVIVLRFTLASAAAAGAMVGVVVLLCASGESLITSAGSGLPPRRRLAGYALAAVMAPVLTLLASLRGRLSLITGALTFVVAVIAVAPAGGLQPRARTDRDRPDAEPRSRRRPSMARRRSDRVPVGGEPQIPRMLRAVLAGRPVPQRQPPGTRRGLRDPMPARCRHAPARNGQSRGYHVVRTKEAGA